MKKRIEIQQINELIAIQKNSNLPIINELMEIYSIQLDQFLIQSHICIQSNDLIALKHLVHRLKSSAGNLGFKSASDICSQIESSIEKKSELNYLEKIDEFFYESKLAIVEFNEYTQLKLEK